MAVAAAVPLVILLNPTWLERIPPPAGKPLLTVLLDRSASMATRDAANGQTRYQAGAEFAAAAARQLSDRYEVRVRTFAETSSPAAPEGLSEAGARRRGHRSGRRRARRAPGRPAARSGDVAA